MAVNETERLSAVTPEQRRLSVLGATGSVGSSTVDLVRRNPERFDVVALTANRRGAELAELDNPDEITKTARSQNKSLPAVLEQVERKMILDRLIKNQWNREKTARNLGINRKALYRKIKLYGLSE